MDSKDIDEMIRTKATTKQPPIEFDEHGRRTDVISTRPKPPLPDLPPDELRQFRDALAEAGAPPERLADFDAALRVPDLGQGPRGAPPAPGGGDMNEQLREAFRRQRRGE